MGRKKKVVIKRKKKPVVKAPVDSEDVVKTINMDGIEIQDALVK
jgi:hypothetical protein